MKNKYQKWLLVMLCTASLVGFSVSANAFDFLYNNCNSCYPHRYVEYHYNYVDDDAYVHCKIVQGHYNDYGYYVERYKSCWYE